MAETLRFDDGTYIVTGAASGIGRETAARVAREGGRVIAVDVSRERLDDIVAALGPAVVPVAGDILAEETADRVLEAAGARIDGLANVAGVLDGGFAPHEVRDDIWDRVLAVNVTGMMRMTRAVLPRMRERGRGSIVNVSSEAGLRGGSYAGAAYTASKFAVHGLTLSTAFFYTAEGIRCNAVAPGPVDTDIGRNYSGPFSDWAGPRFAALQGVTPPAASPDRLAAAIAWLLSDDASYVSGVVLPVDSGMSAA